MGKECFLHKKILEDDEKSSRMVLRATPKAKMAFGRGCLFVGLQYFFVFCGVAEQSERFFHLFVALECVLNGARLKMVGCDNVFRDDFFELVFIAVEIS